MSWLRLPGGSGVKNPPAKQETQARSLSREDPLEKEMETYSSILAWETPWTEEPGGLQSMAANEIHTTKWLNNSYYALGTTGNISVLIILITIIL